MTRPGRGGHTAETRAEVVKAIQHYSYLSIRDIAEVYRISTATVCKWAKEAGVERRRAKASAPTCHPALPFYSRGLCRRCYQREWARPVTLTRGPYRPKVAALKVQRFRGVSRPTVKKRAPWAKVIVRVDTVLIAYESQAEAMEEHGPVSNMLTRAAFGETETRRRAAEKRE